MPLPRGLLRRIVASGRRRRFATAIDTSSDSMPSLSQPLAGLAAAVKHDRADVAAHSFGHTQITRLSNGVRVVSEPKYGASCTVGGGYWPNVLGLMFCSRLRRRQSL